uniref:Uncharacterized protein AlNc14C164G7851 n=1 Tax=Albugo laibachii Nc14 TaxID=890382 RepID=F0WN19_9STRA|nr:conserved hypothetical protein [Albugo laibachii Nc14]|eukprot:CCA22706.1 conserved hypothetical protein [Albugo laibachii Nc14]
MSFIPSLTTAIRLFGVIAVVKAGSSIEEKKASSKYEEQKTFAPVKMILARVVSDQAVFDKEHKTYVPTYYDNFAENFRAIFDTTNAANFDGALMYIQAEGINVQKLSNCQRKNKMAYINIYEVILQQPTALLANNQWEAMPEFAEFIAMDGGACTPEDGKFLPESCSQLFNQSMSGYTGFAVGAGKKAGNRLAPYLSAAWYSVPNSCPMYEWSEKFQECRIRYPGGLCAHGSMPDGEACSFSASLIGYVAIDDLVGITSLNSSATQMPYANYEEFCEDKNGYYKGIEMSYSENDMSKVSSIPFWKRPFSAKACAERVDALIEYYNKHASKNNMLPIPTVEDLTKSNPLCSENSPMCRDSEFGCKRVGYEQIISINRIRFRGGARQPQFTFHLTFGSDEVEPYDRNFLRPFPDDTVVIRGP